jgi:hypothetical protein
MRRCSSGEPQKVLASIVSFQLRVLVDGLESEGRFWSVDVTEQGVGDEKTEARMVADG